MNKSDISSDTIDSVKDYYIVSAFSIIFSLMTIFICILILFLIKTNKPRLDTNHHLLICNTCIASILYSIVTINNYIYLIFIFWERSDISCRWRAYFTYVGIAGVMYSYLIQAISSFFYSVLSNNYRWLIGYKTHNILIFLQWIIVFLITLSSLISKDIFYFPNNLCLISMKNIIHVIYAIFAFYVFPLVSIIIIYVYIYYRVKKIQRNRITMRGLMLNEKRDLELLRNISILISIYLGGGLPSILFFITQNNILYLLNLVTQSLTVVIASLGIIVLDREIRQVTKNFIKRKRRVVPFINVHPTGTILQHCKTSKQTYI